HPGEVARAERVTRTRVRDAEVRAAVPRRDPRRPRAHRTCRGLPDRIQRDPPAPGDLLEPAPGGAPGPGRTHNPQLRTRRNPANYLTRDNQRGCVIWAPGDQRRPVSATTGSL